jgi:predicted phosphodiesterase
MRFAAIADIHGNLDALDAVLKDIARQGVDAIVNLGDHFSGPMLAAETAERLMGLDIVTIGGDQDRRLLELWAKGHEASRRMDFRALQPRHFEWMAAQPETMLWREEVLLCHGSPRDDACYWLDKVADNGAIVARPLAEVEAEAAGVEASLILCAHTHLPRAVRLSDGRIAVNPGSVGLPGYEGIAPVPHVVQTGTPDACYAILERGGGGWNIAFRHVPYDASRVAALASERGMAGWANALATGWVRG